MATILSISSQVVRGTVGNSIGAMALQRLGHTVWQIPTVLFSNHPGHGAFTGRRTPAREITALWQGIAAHGWTTEVDAVLTGYIPTPDAAQSIAAIIREIRATVPSVTVLCDPAVGDEPHGLYVDPDAAAALRDEVMPLADIATPNRFELSWLTNTHPVNTPPEACDRSRLLGPATVITTSVPADDGHLANVLAAPDATGTAVNLRHAAVAHGTGDLFAAAYLGHLLRDQSAKQALMHASADVAGVVKASVGHDELQVAGFAAGAHAP